MHLYDQSDVSTHSLCWNSVTTVSRRNTRLSADQQTRLMKQLMILLTRQSQVQNEAAERPIWPPGLRFSGPDRTYMCQVTQRSIPLTTVETGSTVR